MAAEVVEGFLGLDVKNSAALVSRGGGEKKVVVGPGHVEDGVFVSDEGKELLAYIVLAMPPQSREEIIAY